MCVCERESGGSVCVCERERVGVVRVCERVSEERKKQENQFCDRSLCNAHQQITLTKIYSM